jgi:hypothetical protein
MDASGLCGPCSGFLRIHAIAMVNASPGVFSILLSVIEIDICGGPPFEQVTLKGWAQHAVRGQSGVLY